MTNQIDQLTNFTGSLKEIILMLQNENSHLKANITTMQTTISELEQTVIEQNRTSQEQINKLSVDHKQYTVKEMSSIEVTRNVTAIKNDVSALISASTLQEKKIQSMRDDMTYMHNERNKLQNTTQYLSFKISTLDQQLKNLSTRISFTTINRQYINNIPDNGIIILPDIVTNEGTEFNPKTGVFTASHKGTYVFLASLSTQKNANYNCYIHLVKNDTPLTALFMYSQYMMSDSTFVSVLLEIGDKLWMRKRHYGGTCSLEDMGTFSGFLLYPQ